MFSLDTADFCHFLFAMGCLVLAAHILGIVVERLMIPRVIGEVGAGLILGPTLLGHLFPETFEWMFLGFPEEGKLFGMVYQIGLLMLMFVSGLKFQTKFQKEDVKIIIAVVFGATLFPFLIGWFVTPWLFDIFKFMGTANNLFSLKVVIAISVAVTSIPVISKIFFDLGIMHTRFAKLVVSAAGIHDVLLWAALGVSTSAALNQEGVSVAGIGKSLLITALFVVGAFLSLFLLYRGLRKEQNWWLAGPAFLGVFLVTMFFSSAVAGYLRVEFIFGALLAGIAAQAALPQQVVEQVEQSVAKISFSWFIPAYFAIVGLQLDLVRYFNFLVFIQFLMFASLVEIVFTYLTCRLTKLDRLTSLNFGLAMNARGGPGIVISSVAFGAGIINQDFYAILVILALVSSWFLGTWLHVLLKRGKRLMPRDEGLM